MRKILATALLLLITTVVQPHAAIAATNPTEELRQGVNEIMRLLDDESMPKDDRNERILQLLKDHFEFDVMAQWILGPHWRKATPSQRERFVELYTQLLEETYKGRIASYSDQYTDETVEYTEERIKGDKALVSTMVHARGKAYPVEYKVVKTAEGWRVYDVVIEDISLVRNYRSTYGEVLRNEGFDGLFSRMEEKIEALRRGEETGNGK